MVRTTCKGHFKGQYGTSEVLIQITMNSLNWQLAIIRAENDGFWHFASALRSLYLREHPITVPALPDHRAVQKHRFAVRESHNPFQREEMT